MRHKVIKTKITMACHIYSTPMCVCVYMFIFIFWAARLKCDMRAKSGPWPHTHNYTLGEGLTHRYRHKILALQCEQ